MKKFISFIALVIAIIIVPMGAKAATIVPKCEKSCPTEGGKCTSTCKINVEGNTTEINSFSATLQVLGNGVTVKSLTPGDGWQKVSPSDAELAGTSIPLSLIANNGNITASNFTLATFTLELESSAADCSLKVTNPSIGSEVTIEIETTTETKTGAALPIAIIGCGVIGAGLIYSVTKKNKKMYKI